MTRTYSLGRLPILTTGGGALRALIDAELEPIRSEPAATPSGPASRDAAAVVFEIGAPEVLAPAEATHCKPVRVWPAGYLAEQGELSYRVERAGARLEVALAHHPRRESLKRRVLPLWLRRAHHWNYFTPLDEQAKGFMYNIFDYLTQVANLACGQTYVHASSFCKGQRAVGIFAWGGIGKTTAMLKMVLKDGWQFLSDDLGLIDADGCLWRSPKRIQIYAYNLVGQPQLREALLSRRSLLDRTSWEWRRLRYGTHKVRRRVSAEEIFGASGVARSAPLTDAVFAERVAGSAFSLTPIPVEAFSARCAAIVMSEIQPYGEILNAIHSAGYQHLPAYQEMQACARELIATALTKRGIQPVLWKIPRHAGPDAVHAELGRILEKNAALLRC